MTSSRDIILVTGASGFVGQALVSHLIKKKTPVRSVFRSLEGLSGTSVAVGSIGPNTCWTRALQSCYCVVHLAVHVSVMSKKIKTKQTEMHQINVDGTLNLARQAAAAGIRRFVYLSSVKVNGESTSSGRAFNETDAPNPHDDYGHNKHEAEQGLFQLSSKTGMELVIIRPPLVYGPGVKANFAALIRAVQSGWPLPLGTVHNQRSLVGLNNLVDFIFTCISNPKAANQTFLVSDGLDLSTTELVYLIAQAAGVPARFLPVPVWVLQAAAHLLGKKDVIERLCGSLQVDISKARNLLGWVPPSTVEQELMRITAA
jgi:nucleoside-diphosphate-sugar epimerase